MRDEVSTDRHRCDRQDCRVTHIVEKGKLPPGFSGVVTKVDRDDEPVSAADTGAEFYACRATHIRGAIEAVTSPDEDSPEDNGGETDNTDDTDDESGDAAEPTSNGRGGEHLVSAAAGTQSGER